MTIKQRINSLSLPMAVGLLALHGQCRDASALVTPSSGLNYNQQQQNSNYQRLRTQLLVSTTPEEVSSTNKQQQDSEMDMEQLLETHTEILMEPPLSQNGEERRVRGMPDLVASLREKMGTVDDDRLIHPELQTGEVPRLYSSLTYERTDDGKVKSSRAEGSVLGAAALVAGTTIGAGVLALPTATASAGFLPSSAAMGIAWFYMTMSGLLIAELTLNRIGRSGRPGLGLLELYKDSLGENVGRVSSAAYYFLHYAIMVAYVAQGGTNVVGFLESTGLTDLAAIPGIGQMLFAGTCGAVLYTLKASNVEKINNALVLGVMASFLGIVGIGSTTADWGALVDPSMQHPEEVVNCFPILFLAFVYQNVVPTVVNQLEADRGKIVQAIIAGTSIPAVMFLAFNAVVLGNVGFDLGAGVDPVAMLQANGGGGMIGSLVGVFSMLALITSLIGFTYGLLDAWTDTLNVASEGKEFEKWKAGLYGLVFVPPLALSVANPDIFYNALDYAGAFGVSTLFLVLPPFMVWRERYGDDKTPLATKPMVPFGKIPLGSMYKAAGTLILEQGLEKLGVFEFLSHQFPSLMS